MDIKQEFPSYVTYNEFSPNKMIFSAPEQKQIPQQAQQQQQQQMQQQQQQQQGQQQQQNYYQIIFMYNYGTDEVKFINEFLLEGCVMETSFGIQSKLNSGRMEHSMMVRFDTNNEECNLFINKLELLHQTIANNLALSKGVVKCFNFNPQMAEATGLKNPVYRARDSLSGDIIQGRAPSMFLKLFNRGKPPMNQQTLFTDLRGNKLPWSLLENAEIKFIPLIHIKRLYISGGKASIQMEVVSALVTSIIARGTTTKQLATANRLLAANPQLEDTVSAQIAKITTERQSQLIEGTPNTPDAQKTDTQSTFSGITRQQSPVNVPTNTPVPTPSMSGPSTPGMSHMPTINGLNIGQGASDMIANPPVRTPVIPNMFNGQGQGRTLQLH